MADTIAAIATAGISSAIGIIRLSGDTAVDAVANLFRPSGNTPVHKFESRKLYYGKLLDKDGKPLDHCLCTISRAPHSYTGEDTAELQCHGSPMVLREGLESLFAAGARGAAPGEFTKRAFLNGKMDLIQAEAVADLIAAETSDAARNAASQLGGAVSRKTDLIYDGLTDIMAHFHAVLDYPDEDLDPFTLTAYESKLKSYADTLSALKDSFDRGKLLKDGIKSAIVGKPNVGKSSLLNTLLGYGRAIVTDIPGTTRDTIEEKLRLGGALLRISDTAGLRKTSDPVEKIGVERTMSALNDAVLVLAVLDGSRPLDSEDLRVISSAQQAPHPVAVINKSDLPQRIDISQIEAGFDKVCKMSAKEETGIDELEKIVSGIFGEFPDAQTGEIITNARHMDVVSRALDATRRAQNAIEEQISPDAVLTEVEDAMSALGELTGKTIREDITARIFERFCVGK